MKHKTPAASAVFAPIRPPSEQEISDYAFHLYEQGNCAHGHDVEHWNEVSSCLIAGKEILIPTPKLARTRYEESKVYVDLTLADLNATGEHEVAAVGSSNPVPHFFQI